MNISVDHIWQDFLKIVREEVGTRVVETWVKAVTFSRYDINEKKIYFLAPNMFVKNWVESHYKQMFEKHLQRLLGVDGVVVSFCLSTQLQDFEIVQEKHKIVPAVVDRLDKKKKEDGALIKRSVDGYHITTKLNPLYTFSNFVVGENNSFAYASAKAVVQKLGMLYNPLLLYGCSGLGKTHLLHAIGNDILDLYPDKQVLYQTTDRFVTEFIHAIRFDHVAKFQAKYRHVDILLLDDIQFMVNKEQTQEAFFHIFNSLYESNKQIILSSDTLPRHLGGLVDRLKSRLEWGLIADVQMPMLETKIAILKRKAEMQKENLSDEVAFYIAQQHSTSIRELEGALIRVLAYASLTNQSVCLEIVKKVLGTQFVDKQQVVQLDFDIIVQHVHKSFSYSLHDLRSKDRSKGVSHARHVAMYLMKKYTNKSLREIGEYLDRKDHTTIAHAIHRITLLLSQDDVFAQQMQSLEAGLLA